MNSVARSDAVGSAFSRLLYVARNSRSSLHGITLVLGAGCSLSSSANPLTSESIIRGWVREFVSADIVDSWPKDKLWAEFTQHWNNVGHADRYRYLSERLLLASPGPGYGHLASLIKSGYIRRIVTTNFDLMIDRALIGVPSLFRVGLDVPIRSLEEPIIEVLKVHGDISNASECSGNILRFSPCELDQLPHNLASLIKEATRFPTIVIGYSGADRGLMSSLATESDHTAFWVVPDGLGLTNSSYTGREVTTWLDSRRGSNNIIDGSRLGTFDVFMEELAAHLIGGHEARLPNYAVIPVRWLDTLVSRQLATNYHLTRVASIFLELLDFVSQGKTWNSSVPPFAKTPWDLVAAVTMIFRELPLTNVFNGIPRNEADALLLMLSIEIRVRQRFLGIKSSDVLDSIREMFRTSYQNYEPHQTFWDALTYLIAEEKKPVPSDELRLRLNCEGRLMLVVSGTPLSQMRSMLEVLEVVRILRLSFAPGLTQSLPLAALYQAFQERCDDLAIDSGKLVCRLSGITIPAFRVLWECLFEILPDAALSPDGLNVNSKYLYITLTPGIYDPTSLMAQPTQLFQIIEKRSQETIDALLTQESRLQLPISHTIYRAQDQKLELFLADSKPAALLTGPAGSGKSTSISRLLINARKVQQILAVIIYGNALVETDPLSAFFPSLPPFNKLDASSMVRLAATVQARNRRLLLIVDGLNEASADQHILGKHWSDLIDLAIQLDRIEGHPIKLLITCREGTLATLEKARHIPGSVFFSASSVGEDSPNWIPVMPLSGTEISTILSKNFDQRTSASVAEFLANPSLVETYSNPFWLSIAIKELSAGQAVESLKNPRYVIGKICNDLLAITMTNSADIKDFEDLLEAGFNETLERPSSKCHSFGFAAKRIFGWSRRDSYDAMIRKLIDVGLVVPLALNVLSGFRFVHDLVEEYFLGGFLLRSFENGKIERLLNLCMEGPYFANGLQALLSVLDCRSFSEQSTRLGLPDVIEILHAHSGAHSDLAEIAILAFEERPGIEVDLRKLLDDAQMDLSRHNALVSFMIAGMIAVLERGKFRIPSKTSSALFVLLKEFGGGTRNLSEVTLIRSYCAYRQDCFEDALTYTHLAMEYLTTACEADYGLIDRIEQQRAILLSKLGNKTAAVEMLQRVFERYKAQGRYIEAFEVGLEVGAILRDMSAFHKALIIYDEIGQWEQKVPLIDIHRRALQIGTAKKNILQKITEPFRKQGAPLSEDKQLQAEKIFMEAMHYIQHAEQWAEDNDTIQFKLTCMSEKVECMIIMSCLTPSFISECEQALYAFSLALDRHEMVARRIEFYRETARLEEIKSELEETEVARSSHRTNVMNSLIAGRELAEEYNLNYQITDCNYQIARFCLRALETTNQSSYFYDGIMAIEATIEYFQDNLLGESHYLTDAQRVHQGLYDAAATLGIVFSSLFTKPE